MTIENKNENLTLLKINEIKYIIILSIVSIIVLLFMVIYNINLISPSDIIYIVLLVLMPIFSLLIGLYLFRKKLRILKSINFGKLNEINPENLRKLAKYDKIGALYLFFEHYSEINDENISYFKYIFKNKTINRKLVRLIRYYNKRNLIKQKILAYFYLNNIRFSLKLCLDKNYPDILIQILKNYDDIPLDLFKEIFKTLIESKSYELVFKLILNSKYKEYSIIQLIRGILELIINNYNNFSSQIYDEILYNQ